MTDETLRQALACASRGWPVFPCMPGKKTPLTRHGFRDATTDEQRITAWFGSHPDWNLAIATGAPGPDVLDVDQHGPAGNGYAAFASSARPGCWTARPPTSAPPAAACTPTSAAPTSATATCPATTWTSAPAAATSWPRPPRSTASPTSSSARRRRRRPGLGHRHRPAGTPAAARRPQPHHDPGRDLSHLARWVASQAEGNRNAGLFWAANRALDADPAADLSPLAAAARQAGLGDREITRTLDSARKTGQPRPPAPDYQAEAGDPS